MHKPGTTTLIAAIVLGLFLLAGLGTWRLVTLRQEAAAGTTLARPTPSTGSGQAEPGLNSAESTAPEQPPIQEHSAAAGQSNNAPHLDSAAPPPAPQPALPGGGSSDTRSAPLAGLTIVIDPGHGGDISWNGGAIGVTGLLEKNVNLALGLAVRDQLQALGARVVMTRTTDAPAAYTGRPGEDPLEATTEIAAHSGAQLFVSLHGNWSEDPAPEGIETFYYPGSMEGRRAATDLLNALAAATGLTSRGVTANNFHVLHYHPVPATLLEIGYLSNPGDEALLRSPAFRAKVVAGVVKGIRAYFGR